MENIRHMAYIQMLAASKIEHVPTKILLFLMNEQNRIIQITKWGNTNPSSI